MISYEKAVEYAKSIRVWKVNYKINGFQYSLFIRGTEDEMRKYMDSEMGFVGSYHAINEMEEKEAKDLGFKIYWAPEL